MGNSSLIRFACLATLFSLASCAAPAGPPSDPGTGGSSTGGTTGTAGTSVAGTTGSAGSTAGTTGTAGSTSGTAGRGGTTGSAGSTAGTTGTAGSTAGTTGTAGRGGTTGTAGTGGTAAGGTGGSAPVVDCKGQALAKVGDMTATSKAYLNMGDMRMINNRWGSDELGCAGTTQKVYINSDKTFGWDFNRPVCGGAKAKPDYPEVEFGVAPFGATSSLLTTPSCSTTSLLPKQIKDITIASVKVDTFQITLQKPTVWNIDFEMWLSQRNPVSDANPGVVAEIIVFWGWENGRWACDKSGTVTAGTNTYTLCHQSDDWSTGHWKFYQFNVQGGPLQSFSGTVDVLALTNWVVNTYGLSKDLWVTRLEVGSEIDDSTQGSVKMKNLTFNINGTAKSVELQ